MRVLVTMFSTVTLIVIITLVTLNAVVAFIMCSLQKHRIGKAELVDLRLD